jgi:type IV conjugative transfer system lipoprotein TraV
MVACVSKMNINNFNLIKIMILNMTLILTGCTTYSNQFDCKISDGARCMSVKQINKKIIESPGESDQVFFDEETRKNYTSCNKSNKAKNNETHNICHVAHGDRLENQIFINKKLIYRVQDKTYTVWIAAYENEVGDLVDSHNIYFVIKNDQWGVIEVGKQKK